MLWVWRRVFRGPRALASAAATAVLASAKRGLRRLRCGVYFRVSSLKAPFFSFGCAPYSRTVRQHSQLHAVQWERLRWHPTDQTLSLPSTHHPSYH